MSSGNVQGNAHVHWRTAPLPQAVPYRRQQFHALMAEHGPSTTPPTRPRDCGQQSDLRCVERYLQFSDMVPTLHLKIDLRPAK